MHCVYEYFVLPYRLGYQVSAVSYYLKSVYESLVLLLRTVETNLFRSLHCGKFCSMLTYAAWTLVIVRIDGSSPVLIVLALIA